MAQILELFALVEMTPDVASQQPTAPTIKRIVRTYESATRAEIDKELLEEVSPASYSIIKTIHVES